MEESSGFFDLEGHSECGRVLGLIRPAAGSALPPFQVQKLYINT